jgi:hypothetical protein
MNTLNEGRGYRSNVRVAASEKAKQFNETGFKRLIANQTLNLFVSE